MTGPQGAAMRTLLRILGSEDEEHFTGIVQCDGYSAYQTMANHYGNDLRLAACLAHIRRKFYEARHTEKQLSAIILRLIAHLYRIEKRLREQKAGPVLREAIRSAESAPLYKRLDKRLHLHLGGELQAAGIKSRGLYQGSA